MTREELKNYILESYNAESDFPWMQYPGYEVFRHPKTRKWFALLADVPRIYLSSSAPDADKGRKSKRVVDLITIINVKVDPFLSGSIRLEPGIHSAYHMNKNNWITMETEIVPEEKMKTLIDMSFKATAPKERKPRKGPVRNVSLHRSEKQFPETLFNDMLDYGLRVPADNTTASITDQDDSYPSSDLMSQILSEYEKTSIENRRRIQEAAPRLDRSDTALADYLISLVRQPNQDIIRKIYKDNFTIAAIASEYGVCNSRIYQRKRLGFRLLLNIWKQVGYPATFNEIQVIEKKKEDSVTPKSDITILPFSIRVFNILYKNGIETLEDFISLTEEKYMNIRNLGVKGYEEIRTIQAKAKKILQNNGFETNL